MQLQIPAWIFVAVGVLVMAWGAFRIFLGLRSKPADKDAHEQGGLSGLSNRTHAIYGVVYVAMGIILILTAFGFDLLHFRWRR